MQMRKASKNLERLLLMSDGLTLGVIGETGQLARAIKRALPASCQAVFLNRKQCNLLSDADKIKGSLEALTNADVIIIAAAYTQVDAAEGDEESAMAVNAIAPAIIAQWASDAGIPVIHISTDYVFSGNGKVPYLPHDPVDPINVYGRTKYEGEKRIRAIQPRSAILRTSWLYDSQGQNFLMTMLRLAQSRDSLDVVNDQIGRPTYVGYLAEVILSFAKSMQNGDERFSGVFHVSNGGEPTSWAGFAREIFKTFAQDLPHKVIVNDVTSDKFPTIARRPAYSVLDISSTEALLGEALPDWREGIKVAKREADTL